MQNKLIEQFEKFAADPVAEEFDGALLVNCAVNSDADVIDVQEQMSQLIHNCTNRDAPWVYLREAGFGGNADVGSVEVSSCLDKLLETRRGLPISLGVLLIHLARKLGHETVGVNFPGHFLVRVGETLVDPFRMIETSEIECLEKLETMDGAGSPFVAASPDDVALRMLNNLKFQYVNEGAWYRTLEMLDYQLALAPHSAHLFLERGQFWMQLGGITAARQAFEQVVRLSSVGELADIAGAHLRNLEGQQEILH